MTQAQRPKSILETGPPEGIGKGNGGCPAKVLPKNLSVSFFHQL